MVVFCHAAEHLKHTFDHACGETSLKASARFAEYRHVLLEADDGLAEVIRTLTFRALAKSDRFDAEWE